ncbi:RNA polymerase sigma factor [Sphingobacterium yanglingense]|uniref:RNA polymerase sigma-70 factor (ECF subfamily) n=1 Tax=Sphingobacterium yanglingense TaxID=1437280 RepID=A0A4R6W9L8_9SPHI|nr:RNA polymerase sigma factor [Sphingobacterium yanglingense]TDQ75885.1 RNA polymerase sigma-70 factor (ECF subfamily) [Sphingobacterium yanglingense]
MENSTLNIIWQACKKQDRKAQAALYDYFSKKMLAVCMRYANTTLEAEDILQNGFVNVFTKHHLYDGKGSLEGWVKRIMINVAIETHRKNRGRVTESIDDNESLQLISHINADQTAYKDLMTLVQQLPTGYRTIFNLYAIEGYSHKEIAEMMEISEGNSKSQLSRARQWLQSKLVKLTY